MKAVLVFIHTHQRVQWAPVKRALTKLYLIGRKSHAMDLGFGVPTLMYDSLSRCSTKCSMRSSVCQKLLYGQAAGLTEAEYGH